MLPFNLIKIDKDVVRNTIKLIEENACFSDLSDDPFDINVVKKTVSKIAVMNSTLFDYHAVGYIFQRSEGLESRFTDGSFPVWYGSMDPETTYYETIFHWKNIVIQDMEYDETRPIILKRSIFNVHCNAELVDLRGSVNTMPELIEQNLACYQTTQELGKMFHSEGHLGLYTYSARKSEGVNVAIYQQDILTDVKHLYDVKYYYDVKKSKVCIMNDESQQILCEI